MSKKNNSGTMRSCFVTWNNPEWFYKYKYKIENGQPVQNAEGGFVYEYGDDGKPIVVEKNPTVLNGMSPSEMCEFIVKTWCDEQPGRTAFAAYCISADGLHHIHIVFECDREHKFRYSAVQGLFGVKFHCEYTRGTKDQVEDYINKQGKHEEKGEIVVTKYQHGEIKGNQGNRSDIDNIEQMINDGLNPREIKMQKLSYRKYANMINAAYYDKRYNETPYFRDVKVFWHFGESGSGKSYTEIELREKYGEDVYIISDYQNGGFDKYCGERILFLEEYRSQFPYHTFLIMLDHYKRQVHCRGSDSNCYTLWDEVHLTTPFPPELSYEQMNQKHKDIDSVDQLLRRITTLYFHYIDENGKIQKYEMSGSDYRNLYKSGIEKPYEIMKDLAFAEKEALA